ncbi:MAG TPA: hypothetical protein PK156_14510 [Polyangium sp.]|nr:hypothetical protein [Polyangium sp.]
MGSQTPALHEDSASQQTPLHSTSVLVHVTHTPIEQLSPGKHVMPGFVLQSGPAPQ